MPKRSRNAANNVNTQSSESCDCPSDNQPIQAKMSSSHSDSVSASKKHESPVLGTLSIIFGILGGYLGIVFGLIGLFTYKRMDNIRRCAIGLAISGVVCVILLIVIVVLILK